MVKRQHMVFAGKGHDICTSNGTINNVMKFKYLGVTTDTRDYQDL